MKFIYDDGGREAAGWGQSETQGDCVCRAVAIASGLSYVTIHKGLTVSAGGYHRGIQRGNAEHGIDTNTPKMRMFMHTLDKRGFDWVAKPTSLPTTGRLVVLVSKHAFAVVDGVIHDTYVGTPHSSPVQGYWIKR
jgi:hypothetical protein